MKKIIFVHFLLVFFLVLTSCNSKNTEKKDVLEIVKLPKISVQGNSFVNSEGDAIVFRGLDTSDPDKLEKEGHWDIHYFQEMKDWGATITRFPVHPKAWRERGKENYLKLLDDGVKWASEVGLYVIIDWHSIGNLRENKFFMPMYETSLEETQEFWRLMASKYKDNTTVAFFELFNEPTLYNGTLGTCTWDEWKVINENLIKIIKK